MHTVTHSYVITGGGRRINSPPPAGGRVLIGPLQPPPVARFMTTTSNEGARKGCWNGQAGRREWLTTLPPEPQQIGG